MVGRFAPTPSGRMHVGNVFSALLAWMGVRSVSGRMVLRIEDLDPRAQDRNKARLLMDDLRWLGLDWDSGPYYQSERGEQYQAALTQLAEAGLTYPCFCTRAELHAATAPHASDGTYLYAGTCRSLSAEEVARRSALRPPATRLRVPDEGDPNGEIRFCDLVYGPQHETLSRECGDFLVQRSDGVMAYQLAVVVDDAEMGVTQVVRGQDLLGSCGRQMYLQRLLESGITHTKQTECTCCRQAKKGNNAVFIFQEFHIHNFFKILSFAERALGLDATSASVAVIGLRVTNVARTVFNCRGCASSRVRLRPHQS